MISFHRNNSVTFLTLATLSLLAAIPFSKACAQSDSLAIIDIANFQKELNDEYKDPARSPLEPEARLQFAGHDFFPVDLRYRVIAKFIVTNKEPVFKMKTSSGKLPEYRKYGEVHFKIKDKDFVLNVYQSLDLMKRDEYKDFLFLPFTDVSNDMQTYAGGRYLDLRIPSGDTILIDFNKAYNPYCAYSGRYACPLVPSENYLNIEIFAGVRMRSKE